MTKDPRRDDTNPPPPPPRRAEWAGSVRLGSDKGIDPELIKEAVRRENVLDLETPMPIPKYDSSANRERARVSVTEETRVERGESRRPASSISGAMSLLTKANTWTPGHIALSLAFLFAAIVYLLGGQEGIERLTASSRETNSLLIEIKTEMATEREARQQIAADVVALTGELRLTTGLASALNDGKPNALWQTAGTFDGPPAGQEHRAPRFVTRAVAGGTEQ